ncbi:response regulator transcription factor [Paenibacillus sp. SYP-B3998]|uniref:response regulator transcription factor n=1 Tax=Paenibacillus sp. SYP-B3998 TaxID=2678564 RepID=UPI0031FA1497
MLDALEAVRQQHFDMIILDIMMPDMDGWEVCKRIRESYNTLILMLTARTETSDKVRGLNLGADDYVVKPFEPEELIARVFALIRRALIAQTSEQEIKKIVHPNLAISPDARTVTIKDQNVDLTQKEFDLLCLLADNPHRAYTRDMLLEKLWGHDFFGDVRTVDSHIKNIRDKTRKSGLDYNPIQTVWGVGYKFHTAGKKK